MNENETREVLGIKNDRETFSKELSGKMNSLASELNSGMGDKMMQEIKDNNGTVIYNGFKYRFKNKWKSFKDSLKAVLFS